MPGANLNSWRLALTFRLPELLGIQELPPLTAAAVLVDLAVLYDLAGKAWQQSLPLVSLFATLRAKRMTDADALERPQDLAAYLWSGARLLPPDRPNPPMAPPDAISRLQEHVVLHQTSAFLRLEELSVTTTTQTMQASLLVPASTPSDGSLWVFLAATEQMYGERGQIDLGAARRYGHPFPDSEEVRDGEATRVALRHIEFLSRDTADVRLAAGSLSPQT